MPLFVIVFKNGHEGFTLLPEAADRVGPRLALLSIREREVAALVCKGESNKEIAAHLGKSVLTVKTQLQSIYRKLGHVGRGRLISHLFEPGRVL